MCYNCIITNSTVKKEEYILVKKLLLILVSLGVLLLLSGCVSATCTSSLVIENPEGSGTRTMTFKIHKDKESVFYAKQKSNGELDITDFTIYNNSTYFPKGYKAFADYVASQLPNEGYRVAVDESDGDYVKITLSYSFASFEEYTEKTKALMGEDKWEEGAFVAPQLYVSRITNEESENYGKLALTFAESVGIGHAIMAELVELGFSTAAVEAGVLSPFGDSFINPDCRFIYEEEVGNTDYPFRDYAMKFLALPSQVCNMSSSGYYSFMGKEPTRISNSVQITCYVEDDGSYQLTYPIPDILGVSRFGATDEYEGYGSSGVPLLAKYAPGEHSLAPLPDRDSLNIIVLESDSSNPSRNPELKEGEYSSKKLLNLLVTVSVWTVCGFAAIGTVIFIIKKVRKIRR